MQLHDYADALNRAAANSDYSGMRTALVTLPPDFPNPALRQRIEAINQLRAVQPAFIPLPDQPDPAAAVIAEMRSLVPPQVGMVLCTVPAGKGMLRAANGTRFTFWTQSRYTIVIAGKCAVSGLMLLPAGQHMFMIATYGGFDPMHDDHDPILDDPIQICPSVLNVAAGAVTEAVPERHSNFDALRYHTVYH